MTCQVPVSSHLAVGVEMVDIQAITQAVSGQSLDPMIYARGRDDLLER